MSGTRKSNLFGEITILFVICFFSLPAQAKYGGGSGTPEDPYLIYDASQMNAIGADSNDLDKHFKLMADVDLSEYTGTRFNIIRYFTGVFEGNGHTISNFSYTSTGKGDIGLFSIVSGINSEIKNLGMINPNVDGGTGWSVGSLVGNLRHGTITNCYVEGGTVSSDDQVGGLVGWNYYNTLITNCCSTACVSGDFRVGGLVGFGGTIINCYARGSVIGNKYVGGLVGHSTHGTITNCYVEGPVSGEESVGGIVGYNFSHTISNCYSTGSVSGTTDVGGLVGFNRSTIIGCYSTGSVSGTTDVGGLVGYTSGHVVASFWDIETSGQTTSAGGWGKTTAQMMMKSTFLHWGTCDEAWTINEGVDYPRLAWEQRPGEPIVGIIPLEGDGIPNNPYLIRTPEELNVIGLIPCLWDKHFKLMANIDLSQYTGTDFNIIVRFTGTFDGNGHTIYHFTYSSNGVNYIGLFGFSGYPNAQIKNLGLISPNVNAGTGCAVGSLIGSMGGTITNCYVEGGIVAGRDEVGGLVGENGGIITKCYSTGNVVGEWEVGGLVGENGGIITKCYSTGSVVGEWDVSGLVGYNSDTITNCYSTGSVVGERDIGGLVGRNWGEITNCYSTGSVSGTTDVGGLVGDGYPQRVTNSFWDIETSGQTISAGGWGKTTDQMQTASTFYVWACADDFAWTINEGNDYPRLVWENKSGELITIPPGLYGGGSGEPDDPYLIYTAEQLNMIGLVPCDWDKHFKLMADIDLSNFTGTSFNIIGAGWDNVFTGVFDGNGHAICNFTHDDSGLSYPDNYHRGLFSIVSGVNAELKNLGLINPNIDVGTGYYHGSLVGFLIYGTVTNCYVEGGSISGNYCVGGLVGFNLGAINNCYATGNVEGDIDIGGLVGRNGWCDEEYCYEGTISNCYSTGNVLGVENVGGLVSFNDGEISASFWDIETSGQTTSAGGTGKTTAEMQIMSTFTDSGWDFVGETVNGIEDIWFIPQGDYPRLWWEGMQVPMKLTPGTLNCRSGGNWVKAHITLPEGFTIADVDFDRPAVLHSFGYQSLPLYAFINKDKLVEIEAAFEREAVCSLTGDWPEALTVVGFLTDGNIFLGTSTVRIIHPGMKVIEDLAMYWLNADCFQPDFCDGIDMNRDSLVNLPDYAFLMNINVEFITDE